MELKDLTPNPRNPRKITDQKLIALKKAMLEFGDLGGIVYNNYTKRLCGGHQRQKAFTHKDSKIVIEHRFETPTRTGTTASGYIDVNGERFSYREVNWPEEKEKAANIAANKGAGDWDWDILKDWMKDLDHANFDLDLTMFDKDEMKALFRDAPEVSEDESSDEVATKKYIECPDCGHNFELPRKRKV